MLLPHSPYRRIILTFSATVKFYFIFKIKVFTLMNTYRSNFVPCLARASVLDLVYSTVTRDPLKSELSVSPHDLCKVVK